MQYINATPSQGVFLSKQFFCLMKGFYKLWLGYYPDTKSSIIGFYVFLGDSLVSWKYKKQSIVSLSSVEVEYKAMENVTCEIIRLLPLLKDLHIPHPTLALFFYDNQTMLHIATNHVFHERTKHIEIDSYVIREKIQNGFLKTLHILSQCLLANIMTKSLHPT